MGHPVYWNIETPCILGQWDTLYTETVGHPVYWNIRTPCKLGQWDTMYTGTLGHPVYWDSGTPCINLNYSRLRRKCEIFCQFHTALQTLANLWVILHIFLHTSNIIYLSIFDRPFCLHVLFPVRPIYSIF